MLWHLVLPWLDFSNHREVLLRRVAEGHQEPLHKFYGGGFQTELPKDIRAQSTIYGRNSINC